MPEMTKYSPGTFCWTDLTASDVNLAKRFYGDLFGWTFEAMPMDQGMTYTFAKLRGRDVGALMPMRSEQNDQGARPHWNITFSVANVEAASKKATALGGKLLAPPADVPEAGRMAIVQDPSGATFNLWQAKRHVGAGLMNEPGAMTWAELDTTDVDACGSFYSKLFDWKTKHEKLGGGSYTIFEGAFAGMMPRQPGPPAGVPSYWRPYFAVADCDAAAKRVASLGGKVIVPPTDIPGTGRFTLVWDPQGATFAMLKLAPMP
ncbi:MAG: VOC family protein [Deltaproteobacteria bacterium]